MKCLSLTQPWATLMALGLKRVETRSWPTRYRGELAIHASKSFPKWAQGLCLTEPFRSELMRAGFPSNPRAEAPILEAFPLGAVVGICQLIGCQMITQAPVRLGSSKISPIELEFGDYTVGRYIWITQYMQALAEPIPAKGKLGLWEWETNVAMCVGCNRPLMEAGGPYLCINWRDYYCDACAERFGVERVVKVYDNRN